MYVSLTGLQGRPELTIQGSYDVEHWLDYEFFYKPHNETVRPKYFVPHLPRLDWIMWFQALKSKEHTLSYIKTEN